jgi:hypothetical protein
MAQPKDELYCITDEQGRSAVVNNGVVNFVSTITPLRVSPDGWQEKSIKYARNLTNFGMWRTFTNPLKYVKEAAFIVRDQLYRLGTERKLYQVIHRLDKSFLGGWVHKFFYRGELDLSQAEDSDTSVTVNIMEGDLIKLFKANENTVYELDIDVPEAVTVKMDGLQLKQKATYLVTNGSLENDLGGATLQLTLLGNESVSSINAITEDRVKTSNFVTALWNANTRFLLTGGTDTQVTIKWDFNVFLELASGVGGVNPTSIILQLVVLESDSSAVHTPIQILSVTDPIQIYNHKHHFSGTFTTLVPSDRRCLLYMTATQNREFTYFTYDNDGSFEVEYTYTHRTTFTKGLRPAYIAQKLLDKITGGGYVFTSTYLTTEWENLLLTSGDGIRAYGSTGALNPGFTAPKLKISWADFYEGYNVPANLCEGIRNQQLFIEKKADAFQPTIQVALGAVRNMKPSTKDAKDFQYGGLKIGYPNTDTEDVNGKDEFNVTVTYTSPITRSSKILELISKIIASMYEIELTRINLDGKTTTDNNNDNKNFFLHVEKTATTGTGDEPATFYKLLRNTYTSVTGLISPSTAFNLELHPELCLYRHGNFLRSIFYWQDAGYLVFQTSDKNGNVVVTNNGQTLIGNKNIRIVTLAAPLFIPLVFKVEGPMPNDFIDKMDVGPDGTFSWGYNDELYYGFPLECGIQPANRPAQETTLLCSPVTNLNQLITISR